MGKPVTAHSYQNTISSRPHGKAYCSKVKTIFVAYIGCWRNLMLSSAIPPCCSSTLLHSSFAFRIIVDIRDLRLLPLSSVLNTLGDAV
jgi:hypothetical protein